MNKATQAVVPESERQRKLYMSHHPPIARHAGQRRIYNTFRQMYYCSYMAWEVYVTIDQYMCYVQNEGLNRRKRTEQLFSTDAPLKFDSRNILGLFPKTIQKNWYAFGITCHYSIPERAVPASMTTASHVKNLFLEGWVVTFEILTYLHTDNGPLFVSDLFQSVSSELAFKHLTSTSYHSQNNRQTKCFNKIIVTRPRHYVAEHQLKWAIFVQPLT